MPLHLGKICDEGYSLLGRKTVLISCFDLFLNPEDGGNMFPRNVGLSQNYKSFIVTTVRDSNPTTIFLNVADLILKFWFPIYLD
jgi:hypothetical protein